MRIKVFVTLFIVLLAGGAIMVAGELRTNALEQGSHPTLYTDEIRPATNNSDHITVNASRLFFGGNEVNNLISRDYVVGLTPSSYDGDVDIGGKTGYEAAHQACRSEYGNNSHVCSVEEVAASYAANVSLPSGNGRVIGGPPGFTAPANDCRGYTTNRDASATSDSQVLGKYWDFDADRGFMTTCGTQKKFVCCGGA